MMDLTHLSNQYWTGPGGPSASLLPFNLLTGLAKGRGP